MIEIRKALLLGLMMAMPGCVQSYDYLKPTAQAGALGHVGCAGPATAIVFPPWGTDSDVRVALMARAKIRDGHVVGPVYLLFLAMKDNEGTGGLDLMFRSREAAAQRMDRYKQPVDVLASSNVVTVAWANGERALTLKFPPGNGFVVSDKFFQQAFTIDDFRGDWLSVKLPSFTFQNTTLTIPEVRFEPEHTTQLGVSNC